ncbi:helix-turn-helix domain-containing protein [Paracoccus cavernae]|uniref:helix-turn-helix domain-containing protein n=1 Tax=Paracoccus cavernae TaxID=1571207 RepID=UPI003671890B
MVGQNSLQQTVRMESKDPFLEGLRQIFAARQDLKPATIAVAAGLDNSTLRKLLSGSNSSPRVETAKRIADAVGYPLSDIIALGESNAPSKTIETAEKLYRLDPTLLEEALKYALFLQSQQIESQIKVTDQPQESAGKAGAPAPGRQQDQ